MRKEAIAQLIKQAEINDKIVLLTGDLGFSVLEEFRDKFPDRFFNIGIAEQNMMGIAAGLALTGKIVFVYSIIPFLTMRCFEQIRNDVCYQNLNVKLIGVGAGVLYGSAGPSHHAIEDISILRSLPNMKILSPADIFEAEMSVSAAIQNEGPTYIRLGAEKEKIHDSHSKFIFGKGIEIGNGDIVLITHGDMLRNVINVGNKLKEQNLNSKIISIHTIKPLDNKLISDCIQNSKAIFCIEEHSIIGGLGSSISEIIAESNKGIIFKRIGLNDIFIKDVGNKEFIQQKFKLNPDSIFEEIIRSLRGK